MKGTLHLAWRYLAHNRLRTALLVLCLALTFLLPVAVQLLMRSQSRRMLDRAKATPLVVGSPGSRYDLVLSSLYFRGRVPKPTSLLQMERIDKDNLGIGVPVRVGTTAKGVPVVGTTPDYYTQRKIVVAQGRLPGLIGEAVAGVAAAERLGLTTGGTVLTDGASPFDVGLSYPTRLRVVGILAPSETPDDDAIFVDLKTTWIVDGLIHGHDDAANQPDARVLRRDEEGVILSAAVIDFTEVTPENLLSFHVHGDERVLPITGILVWPRSERGRVQMAGRFAVAENAQMLASEGVVTEVLGFVAALKRFFDANTWLVGFATALFLVLIIALMVRVRERELLTLRRIGSPRGTAFRLLGTELLLQVMAAAVLAGAGGVLIARILSRPLFWS